MDIPNFKLIQIEQKGKISILKLNRPEKKNALSKPLRLEIMEALDIIKDDKKIKTLILYGGEDFFCAGFDKDEVQAMLQDTEKSQEFIEHNLVFHRKFFEFPKLMIAAINGYALGGGFDISVLCHLRVASTNAVFGHPEIGFGACPLFFPYMALVGRGKALELVLNTATRETFINAEEAYRLNIINKLVEPGKALKEAIKLAKQINRSPDFAVSILLKVSTLILDQVKAFEAEIGTIEQNMRAMINP
ncbi:MAG: enoyl-CoA hydratase/isomerase family protein [Candidatus Helarchaeota archaeon]|nr:enoyl-CoA hydratase/isomerase family protein [Candidatus Helarchaeota archaeon]